VNGGSAYGMTSNGIHTSSDSFSSTLQSTMKHGGQPNATLHGRETEMLHDLNRGYVAMPLRPAVPEPPRMVAPHKIPPKRPSKGLLIGLFGSLVFFVLVAMGVFIYTIAYMPTGMQPVGVTPAPAVPIRDGCSEATVSEIYVQREFDCADGSRFYQFADNYARDSYIDLAQHYGSLLIDKGDKWVRMK
jgi:hypothetical protein